MLAGVPSVRFLTRLAHGSHKCSDEVYFDRAGRLISFYTHHSRAISRAAAVGHGRVLQRLTGDTRRRARDARSRSAGLSAVAARCGTVLAPAPGPSAATPPCAGLLDLTRSPALAASFPLLA